MAFPSFSPIACSLSLLVASSLTAQQGSVDAFTPSAAFSTGRVHANDHHQRSTAPGAAGPLHVSVVSQFVTTQHTDTTDQRLAFAFEAESPQSIGVNGHSNAYANNSKGGVNKRRSNRKHNFVLNAEYLNEAPDLDFYTLHSSNISHLHRDMPIDDITQAIKRAQNRHDIHDLQTIASFLIDECDENWGYGFRGSLLSRLAVAALHVNELDTAQRAIETRRVYERPSMQPHESAAVIRGLMRAGSVEDGWDVLEDELRLPLDGTSLSTAFNKELLTHRARSLASIATRHFFEGEPYVAAKALEKIFTLGELVGNAGLHDEVEMPWARLVNAATQCNEFAMPGGSYPCKFIYDDTELPSDLTDLVWNAMLAFPCPGEEDECTVDDYLLEP